MSQYRYNIVVEISANIGVQAPCPEIAKKAIERLLEAEPFIQVGEAEFIVENAEVTGVFNKEWIGVLEKEPIVQKGRSAELKAIADAQLQSQERTRK